MEKQLTPRQKVLKFIYPIILFFKGKDKVAGKILENTNSISPPVSFYSLKALGSNGKEVSMDSFRGKKVIVVNVASNCGYTNQYESLESIYQAKKEEIVFLGFPANDFNNQEAGSDESIAQFCKLNFGVTFPLFKKNSVLAPNQNEVYTWLTNPMLNGWNSQSPTWNFCKYLIDENGKLKGYYASAVEPSKLIQG